MLRRLTLLHLGCDGHQDGVVPTLVYLRKNNLFPQDIRGSHVTTGVRFTFCWGCGDAWQLVWWGSGPEGGVMLGRLAILQVGWA